MRRRFKEYKIKASTSWFSGTDYQVWEYVYKPAKPPELVKSTKKFSGGLLECKAYLELLNNGDIFE